MPVENDARTRLRDWFAALGPGAIVASLTIGTGELIFSTRAGALFGYQVLGLFLMVLVLKWALVFASARHWVLSDAHPFDRWTELPGPRGWLPWVLVLLAIPAFPIWISFHAGTIGTLLAAVTHTRGGLAGNVTLAWGIGVLLLVFVLSGTGGYSRLEKIQSGVVALMVLSVLVALARLNPDGWSLLSGFIPASIPEYPEWVSGRTEFDQRPVWLELATYAGVIGGSGYDYLAYVAWLRERHGGSAERRISAQQLRHLVAMDASVSFLTVLLFSAAFVACGTIILSPQQQVPAGSDLLTLQAQFVAAAGVWLKPLYFIGAFLALTGTLYGTLEVAPAILQQVLGALMPWQRSTETLRWRKWAVIWCGGGGLLILAGNLAWRLLAHRQEPFDLVALVTPANLFTGVLACGWISFLNVWADRRFLPKPQRMGWSLMALNLLGGVVFCGAGLKAAWDQGRWTGPVILLGCIVLGLILARITHHGRNRSHSLDTGKLSDASKSRS